MRKLLIIFVVILQVILLAYMAGQRENVLRTGKTIYLRTVPVDPRDLFRGDYVRLQYEISNIEREKMQDGLKLLSVSDSHKNKDKKVYAVLEVNDDNVAEVVYVTDKKPEKGKLFIRGRVERFGNFLFVRYGIEAYFMQQGAGKDLEKRNVDGNRASLEMQIALGSDGTAVIKNHRWTPISINLTDLKLDDNMPQSAKIVLTNISEKPVAIVVLPNNGSLKVEPDEPRWWWSGGQEHKNWRWVNENASAALPEDKNVRMLDPDCSYEFAIDFSDPYWLISVNNQEPVAMNKYNFAAWLQFRLVYQPPSKQQCEGLKDADLIWHGKISSQTIPNRD
ncbi:MAG TPA: hypothetical protein DDW84_03655 [Phycisphaerales bacterium]|nr:MAG: hypothetical protein A2Y13_12215 [Planctomycetes bacterium GWC2_45_44]HBG77932.1 hypothetical protein [Phycisphaerales bacterium]HBR20265.1 hypothetical protein [Phycisphaerales bacterium]